MEIVTSNYAISMLISLPFISLASFLFYPLQKYNYFEHLVLNAYMIGQTLVISFILIPVLLIMNVSWISYLISAPVTIGYFIWFYMQVFTAYSPSRRVVRMLLTGLFAYIVIVIGITIFIFMYSYTLFLDIN